MTKEELDFFKKLLTAQLSELLGVANNTISSLLDVLDNAPDPLDRATMESERSSMLRIRDRESKLILKIIRTLERI